MLRTNQLIPATLLTFVLATPAFCDELSDKVDVGDYAPSYASTKCGGADDGVAIGKTTCYTCRAGSTPVFYIFLKDDKPGDAVMALVKKLDALVGEKKKDKVVGVVNVLGDPKDESLRTELKDLGEKHALAHLAITVTADGDKFDLNDTDDVTVMMYEKGIIRLRTSAKAKDVNEKSAEILIRRSKALIE